MNQDLIKWLNLLDCHKVFSFDLHTYDIDREIELHLQKALHIVYNLSSGFSPKYLPRSILSLWAPILKEDTRWPVLHNRSMLILASFYVDAYIKELINVHAFSYKGLGPV